MADHPNEESVARYYDTAIFEAALARLTRGFPVERAITLRWLERLAPAKAELAKIGVSAGIYCVGTFPGRGRGTFARRRSGRIHCGTQPGVGYAPG